MHDSVIDGIVVIDDESTSGRNAFGSITLTPGFHTLDLLYCSDGDNTELELFSARGQFTAFDAAAFRLVAMCATAACASRRYRPQRCPSLWDCGRWECSDSWLSCTEPPRGGLVRERSDLPGHR